MTDVVFLHIGLFKSGTTYLQHVLWESRDVLADEGILVPGRASWGSGFAAVDVLGVPRERRSPTSYGAWDRFVESTRDWQGSTAVLSSERLTFAGPDTIRRMIADLAPASVKVVITVRDLARVIPSSWQERMRNRKTMTWPEFLAAVTDPNTRDGAKDFWRQQDAPAQLAKWRKRLPVQNFCVVTVPAHGRAPHLLAERFAAAIGSDVARWTTDVDTTHTALGMAEAEMLRRLNPRLPDEVTTPDYNRIVKLGLARHALAVRDGRRQIRMPDEYTQWLGQQAQQIIDGLRQPGYHVVGDLGDLMPATPASRPPDVFTVTDSELLHASIDVSAYLITQLAERQANADQAAVKDDPPGVVIPGEYANWLERHAPRAVEELRTLGHNVVGDDEQVTSTSTNRLADAALTDGALLDGSLDINAYLVTRLAERLPSAPSAPAAPSGSAR